MHELRVCDTYLGSGGTGNAHVEMVQEVGAATQTEHSVRQLQGQVS